MANATVIAKYFFTLPLLTNQLPLPMEQSPASRFVEVLSRLGYKTQQQIADLLEIARPTAGTIVRYEKPPSIESVIKLKQAHPEISMEWIFTGLGAAYITGDTPPVPASAYALRRPANATTSLAVAQPTREEYAALQEELRRVQKQLADTERELALKQGTLSAVEEDRQWLRSQVGGKAEASSDAAGEDAEPPLMEASRNHEFVAVPEEMPVRRYIGYAGNYVR